MVTITLQSVEQHQTHPPPPPPFPFQTHIHIHNISPLRHPSRQHYEACVYRYVGHSWASGLFEFADGHIHLNTHLIHLDSLTLNQTHTEFTPIHPNTGRNQESTSEALNAWCHTHPHSLESGKSGLDWVESLGLLRLNKDTHRP
jgi:hypothetical protein